MATQVFLREFVTTASVSYRALAGTSYVCFDGASRNFDIIEANTSRGDGVNSVTWNTVDGPTSGQEIIFTNLIDVFATPPISSDVTIAGSITINFWALESSMSANAAINCRIVKWAAIDGALTEIAKTARTVELGTSAAVQNFSVTPTSTALARGDRILIVPFIDDSTANMASGFTVTLNVDAASAGVNGDSYVTFTETFGFESAPAGTTVYLTDTAVSALISDTGWLSPASAGQLGGSWPWSNETNVFALDEAFATNTVTNAGEATNRHISQQFGVSLPAGSLVLGIAVRVWITSSENATLSVQLRNTGSAVGSVATTSVTFGVNQYYELGGYTHDWGTVFTESNIENSTSGFHFWLSSTSAGAEYSVDHTQIKVFYGPPATGRPREAWTSRGAGVQTDVTNTAAGPTAKIQVTDTAGGTAVSWFTKQLAATTLSGPVLVNVRGLESNFDANASLLCEIARVDSDGTNPSVWGINGALELGSTEEVRSFWVTGDDLAISDGQRLRIRLFIDDAYFGANTAALNSLAASHTVTSHYAGTSGGASGDAFLTFTQTLTEFVVAAPRVPKFSSYPQILAH